MLLGLKLLLIDTIIVLAYKKYEEELMKRILFLSIYFFFFGSLAYGQNTTKIDLITKQIEQLVADYFAQKITAEEYKQKQEELQIELRAAYDEDSDSTPVDGNRLEQLYDQYYTLTAANRARQISDTEYKSKAEPIANEIKNITERKLTAQNFRIVEEVQNKVKKLWPGTNAGWPPSEGKDSVKELCGLGPFVQSAGTRASYSSSRMGFNGPINFFALFQTGQTDSAFNEMKRQVERMAGKPMERHERSIYKNGEFFRVWVANPGRDGTGLNLDLYITEQDAVVLDIAKLHD
jgi:hypothetical protein